MRHALLALVVLLLPTASRAQTPAGDAYLCYKATLAPGQPGFTPVQKTLQDQFDTFVADVTGIQSVCNPIQTPQHPEVHQVAYKIVPAAGPRPALVQPYHVAYDQFGLHPIKLLRQIELRAPSAKVLGADGTGTVDTTGVDHFECYKTTLDHLRGWPKNVGPWFVTITDEFGTANLKLTRLTKVCTPVNKNGEDVSAPQHVRRLACYRAQLTGGKFAARTVSVNNTNFGPAVLVARSVGELCAPAFQDNPPTCSGAEGDLVVGGHCWHIGDPGQSCDAACAAQGSECDIAISTYAGSGGTLQQCGAIANAFGVIDSTSNPPSDITGSTGVGCSAAFVPFSLTHVTRTITPPTTCDASDTSLSRICACAYYQPN